MQYRSLGYIQPHDFFSSSLIFGLFSNSPKEIDLSEDLTDLLKFRKSFIDTGDKLAMEVIREYWADLQ